MRLFQAADVIMLTGLTKHQLREWTGRGRRGLIPPDVEPGGPGRHALYSWQTLLVLRLLRVLHEDFAAEVGAWVPAAHDLRDKLDHVSFPTLWRSSVVFESRLTARIVEDVAEAQAQMKGVILPFEPHLTVLSTKVALPRPDQLSLFPPMAVSR